MTDKLQWDRLVEGYKAQPSEEVFSALYRLTTKPPDSRLAAALYQLAANADDPLLLKHFCHALMVAHHFLEAELMADRWVAREPDSIDAHRVKALIALRRGSLHTARQALARLKDLGAEQGLLAMFWAAAHLLLGDFQAAAHNIRAMYELGTNDVLRDMIALEVVEKSKDPDLLIQVCGTPGAAGKGVSLSPRLEKNFRKRLLERVAHILAGRSNPSSHPTADV